MKLISRFFREDAGMETVEWAIMAGLIVVGVVAVVAAIGTKINDRFTALNSVIN